MQQKKSNFIQFALDFQVLQFGEFTLKSGRLSPYFFNAGLFYQGSTLKRLGQFYAQTLKEEAGSFQHLFGPAYKGLPLATATAIGLAELDQEVTVTFNRKEVKDHGEGGQLIGAPLKGKTIIVDDVITAGTAFRESQTLINAQGGQLTGVIIALDRCERGLSNHSTLAEITAQGIAVYSLITAMDLMAYLRQAKETKYLNKLETYLAEYGCS